MARRTFTPEERAFRSELRELGLSRSDIDAIAGAEASEANDSAAEAPLPEIPAGERILELGAEMGAVTVIECEASGFAVVALDQSGLLIDEPVSLSVQHFVSFDEAWEHLSSRGWLALAPLRVHPEICPHVQARLARCEAQIAARQVEWRAVLAAPDETGT